MQRHHCLFLTIWLMLCGLNALLVSPWIVGRFDPFIHGFNGGALLALSGFFGLMTWSKWSK